MDDQEVLVRRATAADVAAVAACHSAVYHELGPDFWWEPRTFELQQTTFPDGQFVAVIGDRVIGYASSLIVQLDDNQWYREDEITGAGSLSTHEPGGDTLYGVDIGVLPEFRGRGISTLLYVARKALVQRLNLRRMIAYGRLPGYADVAGKITVERYVRDVIEGKRRDRALNAHLATGYEVKRVLLDHVKDEQSLNYCTVLEYENPTYDPTRRQIMASYLSRSVRKMRVCAAQYRLRRIDDFTDLEEQVRFFARVAYDYHCHFLVLPEYFSAQVLSMAPHGISDVDYAELMTSHGPRIIELTRELAMEHRLFIVAGSHLVRRDDGLLYNVSHLITPAGEVHTQDKLHITPSEREDWDVQPGDGLAVFETPFGRIGVLICYDVEFPELTRALTMAGVEVLFVPFSTDTEKAYHRVRYCAHARAIENYIYVVMAGNVGSLPGSHGYTLNYGKSAVITPSDSAFPPRALLGEADPNTETVVIADLDLGTLEQQRQIGSVRPLLDMRRDLYQVQFKIPIRRVRIS